jgi:serine phosphatase RsbU (regulator of sigma subunit)
MASMRFSIRAYVSQGDEPREILAKLARVVSVQQDGAFATVLCVVIDVTGRTIEVTSAGHLPPLLVAAGGNRFVEGKVGVPVGVAPDARYETTTVAAPAGASLVAYTDGLVERRGESIDAGLERLRVAATPNGSLDGLLDELLNALGAATADDDTAIAGIRWRT